MLRYNLAIPEPHHFKKGNVFVTFSHPNMQGKLWFSSGEAPNATGYSPATWHEHTEQGPVAYFSGELNPIILVNVMSKPMDISDLSGGMVSISYGISETNSSTVADAYTEMTNNNSRAFLVPVVSSQNVSGVYDRYCFTVTSVKRTTHCDHGCLVDIVE